MGKRTFKILVYALLLCMVALKAHATKPPLMALDTTNFSMKINAQVIEPSKLNDLLRIVDREFRKVERTDKTLYIYDEFGFTIIKEKKGITFSFLFSKGSNDDEPKNAFNVNLMLNKLEINSNTAVGNIKLQLPKAEKALQMDNMFIYIHKKMVSMCESKDGKFIRFDIGYKTK